MNYTDEQTAIIDASARGDHLVVNALAGTGKTTTLVGVARRRPAKRMLYLAYNKAIQVEAKTKMPRHVDSRTSHSLAWRPVLMDFRDRLPRPMGTARRISASAMASALDIFTDIKFSEERRLTPAQQARAIWQATQRFSRSAAQRLDDSFIPRIRGLETVEDHARVVEVLAPYLDAAWADLASKWGRLRFTGDVGLKLWHLSDPFLPYEVILFDEAQDANPVLDAIVAAQAGHAQIVRVGDENQSIYQWRGAVNAMQNATGNRLALTQSFRFGRHIAEEANRWLTFLGSELRVVGFDQIHDEIASIDWPRAVLCRTNADAVAEVMAAQKAGKSVNLVGGKDDIVSFAKASIMLKAGVRVDHPDLAVFENWAAVQEYVSEPEGQDLATLVKLIDDFRPEVIIDVLERTGEDSGADVTISTGHKAKGLEWPSVRVAGFQEPRRNRETNQPGQIKRPEAMLIYVAVTRAMHALDVTSLEWANDYLARGIA